MKTYTYILFDLDGTITDPGLGITNAVMYALTKCGIEVPYRNELYRFIGPPLQESFQTFYGFSKEDTDHAVRLFREYFTEKGIFENNVYEGFEDLLNQLKTNHHELVVATSKPEVFAKQILDHFGLSSFFKTIAGSELDGTRVHKDEVIRYALQKSNITDLENVVMIGDRKHDIVGAKKVGLDSIGVLFGYGSRAELEEAGADYIAESVSDLKRILMPE